MNPTSLFDLTGRVALVTGASRGIGKAIASQLAAQGATVVGTATSESGASAITEYLSEFGGKGIALNVTDKDSIDAIIKEINDTFGGIDILVNNAGIQKVSPIEDFPEDAWDAIVAINLSSSFHTTKAVLPVMRAAGWGRIINIASAHGLVASPFKSAYVAAKHGIMGLTKTTALECATDNITCNAICPGYVMTPLVEKQVTDTAIARGISEDKVKTDVMLKAQWTKKFVEVEELADTALFLCSNSAQNITGSNINVDGGWTAA